MNRTILAAVALSLAVAAAPAHAKTPAGSASSGTELSFSLDLAPGPYGAGAGFRVGIPLVPQGLIHGSRVRDELLLEVGGDFLHYDEHIGYPYDVHYSWNGIAAVGGLAWNFWLTQQFALYPKIDLGLMWGWYSGWDPAYGTYYDRHSYAGPFAQVAGGLIYRLQSVDLRAELGTEMFRVGVGFRL
jgi:hypothetical protein